MNDLYHSIANSPLGRKLFSAINLPIPVELERWVQGQSTFIKGKVLVGTTADTAVIESVLKTLGDASCTIQFNRESPDAEAIEQAAQKAHVSITPLSPSKGSNSFKALIFDASEIETSGQLKALYEFFHPVIRNLEPCGRVVVIGRPPENANTPEAAAAHRSLEGFTRSLGKETGKKGITTQLVYVTKGAENQLVSSLRFLLSPKSAYVSAQVLRISRAKAIDKDFNWIKPLEGKKALVTGASRGIGLAIAKVLARDGAKVIGLDIPAAETELKQAMGSLNAEAITLDISEDAAPQQLVEFAKSMGGFDVIVHNAGVTRDKTLGGMPEHFWDQVININLSAVEKINNALLGAEAINEGGRIVCVSSMNGIAGSFGQTNYAVSKAGLIGYVHAMASVVSKQEITINAVAPGFIETQMTAAMPFAIREVGRRMNALSQGGKPVDVAETIAFFASGASSGVNGNVLRVCGQSLIGA